MTNQQVKILLAAGIVLAIMYLFVYFQNPSGTTGAFASSPSIGHTAFVAVIVILAFFGLWQSKNK